MGLQCYYSDNKPTWMDGGEQQRLMNERLKDEIKRNASLRRRRKKIRSIEREIDDPWPPCPEGIGIRPFSHIDIDRPTGASPTPPNSNEQSESPYQNEFRRPNQSPHQVPSHDADIADASSQPDFEPSLLMSYLDYAFPILFPFYKPSILEGGRSWLLTLALKHPAFYHNIVGLAAYFYCAVPVAPGPEHDACAVKAQTELRVQMEKAVQGVQDSLSRVTQAGIHNSLTENFHLLGNIAQLITFEVAFASSENWQIHLNAAVSLFDQTLRHFSPYTRADSMMNTLLEKLRCNVPLNCSVWSADQAALRFFTATIIYQDVIASTTREETPRLLTHHDGLLVGPNTPVPSQHLKLENFIGCQTWVMRSIAKIASLCHWKKACKQAGSFDIVELVQRGTCIEHDLSEGIDRLTAKILPLPSLTEPGPYRPLETILAKSNIPHGSSSSNEEDHDTITLIWAYAAQVYLITVLSGWQPRHVDLRRYVTQALQHLRNLDNPAWLRTLAWPICVTGSLATKEQEETFRQVANVSGGLAMFGTLRDALAIMEKVWDQRDLHNPDTWDIASCLRILGHNVLLV